MPYERTARSPIEKHPDRPAIERALAMGVTLKQIAKRYGFSLAAVSRYRDRMPAQLRAAIIGATLRPGIDDLEQLRRDESAGLLGNLAHQRARLLLLQDECMEEGAVDQVARLSGVIHKNLDMVGRYLGLFASLSISTNVNVLLSEDYLRLRQALTEALRPFPEARRAVAETLHRMEGQVAAKMLAANPPGAPGAPGSVVIEQSPPGSDNGFPRLRRPREGVSEEAGQ